MQASMGDGQTIAGDNAGGSAGGKGIRGIIPFGKATGLRNTVSSVDGMPSNRQYNIAANFEVRDDGTISKIPAYYTAQNTNTNQIDYVIGQTDLPKFMSDPFSNRVQAWAGNQPAYGREAGNALINLTTGAMDLDGARVQQGAGQLMLSWKDALTSPDYLATTALSWAGGAISKEAVLSRMEYAAADDYASKLYRFQTPTGKASGLFEVEQTGPYNYRVPAGNTTIDIDGYQGPTMLDAKFVGKPSASPYVTDSNVPSFLRDKILKEQQSEFLRYKAAIDDPAVPFNRLNVLTNEPKALPYFQSLMDQYKIPGTVKVVPTNVPQSTPKPR